MRFGLVGCGVIAPTHAKALAKLSSEDVRLVACSDIVPERAQEFAKQFDIKAVDFTSLIQDPEIDAISVCTPSGLHAEIGVAALEASKHVIIEKPMEVSLEACDRLIAAERASGKTLSIISQHRFDAASIVVKDLVAENALGSLVLADARICWYRTQDYYDSGDWRGTWAMDGGGALMNQGVHTVDLMRWICGPVATINAQARTSAHERIEVEDVVVATLTFVNGAIGTLVASTAAYPGFAARLAVYGTRGSAVIEGDHLQSVAIQGQEHQFSEQVSGHALKIATGGTRSASKDATEVVVEEDWKWGDAHSAQFANFIRACREGVKPLVDSRSGRDAVAVIQAVYESARTGQTVVLNEAAE